MSALWFPTEGPSNTAATLQAALGVAAERTIGVIVVATTSGETALALAKLAKAQKWSGTIVAVSHVWGFKEKGQNSLNDETRKELASAGVPVVSATHVLSGAERAISNKFQGTNPVEIIAHSLRLLGAGTKVAVEITAGALDNGAIPYGEDVIAIGGTRTGADTAVVIRPAYSASLFEARIKEFIAKPQ